MVSPFDKLLNLKNPAGSATLETAPILHTPEPEETFSIKKSILSGIEGFDVISVGGFNESSTNLLSGAPGTGKTTFAVQFLLGGIKSNETGVYISFDERKESVYDNMLQFGWKLKDYEDDGKFIFVEYTPEQIEKILAEGGGLLDNLMEKTKAKRLVIDSISSFLLLDTGELSKRESSLALFKLLRKWDVTTLLTFQDSSVSSKSHHVNFPSIDYEVDSITLLYYIQKSMELDRQRLIEIYKMRGKNHSRRPCPFQMTPSGIKVFPQGFYDDKGNLIQTGRERLVKR